MPRIWKTSIASRRSCSTRWICRKANSSARALGAADGAAEALGRAQPRLRRLDHPVLRRRARHQRVDQAARHPERVVDGAVVGALVLLRRVGEATQLAHELDAGGADLVVRGGGIEVEQGLDAAAHASSPVGRGLFGEAKRQDARNARNARKNRQSVSPDPNPSVLLVLPGVPGVLALRLAPDPISTD